MKYTLFLAANPANLPAYGSDEFGAFMGAFGAYNQALGNKMLNCAPVQPARTATLVSATNKGVSSRQGSLFQEEEQMTGWYLIECEDESEAISWAEKTPVVQLGYGVTEVRPVMEF